MGLPQKSMDVPGQESEYKDELYRALDTKYDVSELSVPPMSKIYEYTHSGVLPGEKKECLGIIDRRNISPESLEQALNSLMSATSDQYTGLQRLANEPHIIIIGVTNQITPPVRKYIDNEASRHDRTYPFEMYVVDVGAGTVLGTGRKYAPYYGEQLKKNYLKEPLN